MSGFWGSVAEGKAKARAAAFIGAMGVLLVWSYLQDHTPRVRTERASATIVDVKETGWHVKLVSGEMLWLAPATGVALKAGEAVPVLIETYESGNRRVRFDRDRWLTGG